MHISRHDHDRINQKLVKLGLVQAVNASVSQDRLGLTGVSPRHHFLYIFSVKITSKESPCGS